MSAPPRQTGITKERFGDQRKVRELEEENRKLNEAFRRSKESNDNLLRKNHSLKERMERALENMKDHYQRTLAKREVDNNLESQMMGIKKRLDEKLRENDDLKDVIERVKQSARDKVEECASNVNHLKDRYSQAVRDLERQMDDLKRENHALQNEGDESRLLKEKYSRMEYELDRYEKANHKIRKVLEVRQRQLVQYSIGTRKLQDLRLLHTELHSESKKIFENCGEAHRELDEIYQSHRNVLRDLIRLSGEHGAVMEELFSKQAGPLLIAHDSSKHDDPHYDYTKKMAEYVFRSEVPLQGNLDFTKFQVTQYTPALIRENPGARFEILLYFVMASGGRHAIPSNKILFANLKERSDQVYIIACRNKVRYGNMEDLCQDQDILKEGIPCLNFLMAQCKIRESSHNTEVLRRIHRLLPPPRPLPSTWYEKYSKIVDPEGSVQKKIEMYRPRISPTPEKLMVDSDVEKFDFDASFLPPLPNIDAEDDIGPLPVVDVVDDPKVSSSANVDSVRLETLTERVLEEVKKISSEEGKHDVVLSEKVDRTYDKLQEMIEIQKTDYTRLVMEMRSYKEETVGMLEEMKKKQPVLPPPHIVDVDDDDGDHHLEKKKSKIEVDELNEKLKVKDEQISKLMKVSKFYTSRVEELEKKLEEKEEEEVDLVPVVLPPVSRPSPIIKEEEEEEEMGGKDEDEESFGFSESKQEMPSSIENKSDGVDEEEDYEEDLSNSKKKISTSLEKEVDEKLEKLSEKLLKKKETATVLKLEKEEEEEKEKELTMDEVTEKSVEFTQSSDDLESMINNLKVSIMDLERGIGDTEGEEKGKE